MREEFRSIDSSNRAVRGFGALMGTIAVLVAVWITWKAGWEITRSAVITAASGGLFALIGLVLPAVLRPVFLLWMMLAVVLGFVMTRVILTIVFTLVVTPIGVVMRLLGKNPLARRPDPGADSYWVPVDRGRESPEEVSARLRRYY